MKRVIMLLAVLLAVAAVAAVPWMLTDEPKPEAELAADKARQEMAEELPEASPELRTEPVPEPAVTAEPEPSPVPEQEAETELSPEPTPEAVPEPMPESVPEPEPETVTKVIVIDPGHQQYGNFQYEPIGPGAAESKYRCSGGTSGVSTGTPEYELTLKVSLLLRDELEARGYEVVMTRETNDVDISNAERAEIANEADADVFIRVHANGSEVGSVAGMLTMCMTRNNPFNAELYPASRRLSELVLQAMADITGAECRSILENDTMSGINYSLVPVTIVEMGFMTNPEEDELMATEEYQLLLAQGMADGIDLFFMEEQEADNADQ